MARLNAARKGNIMRACALALILLLAGLLLVPAQFSFAEDGDPATDDAGDTSGGTTGDTSGGTTGDTSGDAGDTSGDAGDTSGDTSGDTTGDAGTVRYNITVNGGRAALGPGEEPLTAVEIVEGKPFLFFVFAETSDADREFDHWEAEGAVLSDYQKSSSCFTMSMPANDLVLTAVFRDTDPNKRLAGSNRYATSQAVANDYMKGRDAGYFDCVVVASGDSFPDALAGSYLAAMMDAPLLMVNSGMASNVADYIRSHAYPSSTVYILGGTSAVPASFETLITGSDYGFKAVRLAGSNRYATNLSILDACDACGEGRTEDLIVCSGKNFADALSASSLGIPILLVGDTLLPAQLDFLKNEGIGEVYIAGGTGAVSQEIGDEIAAVTGKTPVRLSGANRYATSAAIAEHFSGSAETGEGFFSGDLVFFASGANFPDGLAGGPLAFTYGAPLLLIDKGRTDSAANYTGGRDITKSVTLGGTGVLPDDVVTQAKTPLTNVNN